MDAKELKTKLFYSRKNVYEQLNVEQTAEMNSYAENYKKFMDVSKTEREAVKEGIRLAAENGYVPYKLGDKINVGGKYYLDNRGKSLYLFRIGSEPITEGIRIAAAHIDSPRLDLKQNPIYEEGGLGFFKTHYYGGIKKYQWTAIPLALHGTIIRADGTKLDIALGEDENDPVFYVDDLLPHLAKDQYSRNLGEAIPAEQLNILLGSQPFTAEDTDERVRLNLMLLLNEKYGITEADFMSSELTAVPAFKARDIGFDRSLIGAYGHDDRVCAYPSLTALFSAESDSHTIMVILADKEETGSDGNTGMKTRYFSDIIDEIASQCGATGAEVRSVSKCLSADVSAAYDPNFADAYDKRNSAFVNNGVVLTKYTGSRGKSGTNDASGETVAYFRDMFDKAGVVWQTAELGKADQGGGGTVAAYIAQNNIDTIDLGVAVLSMHAPYEVISKADLYMTHKALAAFMK